MGRRRALEGLVDKVNNDIVGEHRRKAAIQEKVWREGRGKGRKNSRKGGKEGVL